MSTDTKCCTKCKQEKPRTLEFFKPCKHVRDGLYSWCRDCSNAANRARDKRNRSTPEGREKNRKKVREHMRQVRATPEGREKLLERERKWREENRETYLESLRKCHRKRRKENPDKCREQTRKQRAANPEKFLAYSAKRRALKRAAIDLTATPKAIEDIFDTARLAEEFTGKKFSVDHIIPLARGGRHHEANLRHIPSRLNSIKSYKLDREVTSPEFQHWISGANVFEQVSYITFHKGQST